MISVQGISFTQLLNRTRDAMGALNGSPITRDSKVRAFLVRQFGLSNEHVLSHVFGTDTPPQPPEGLVDKLLQNNRFTYEEWAYLQQFLPLPSITAGAACQRCGSRILPNGFCSNETCPHLSLVSIDTFTHEEWAHLQRFLPLPSMTAGTACQRCGSRMLPHGFCSDETCPHSDYSQDVDLSLVSIDKLTWEQARKIIPLTATTDDGQITVTLDASSYFYQKLREKALPLCDLISENFDGGHACDDVLQYLSEHDAQAAKVLDYCALGHSDENPLGYRVEIERASVKQFLRMAAPNLVAQLA